MFQSQCWYNHYDSLITISTSPSETIHNPRKKLIYLLCFLDDVEGGERERYNKKQKIVKKIMCAQKQQSKKKYRGHLE